MKVAKYVMDDIIHQFERSRDITNTRYNNVIESLKKAETVETVMEIKRDFISMLILNLPLTADTCYFCRLNDNTCKVCKYAKKHGRCGDSMWYDVDSDYGNINEVFGSEFAMKSSWDKIRDARNFFETVVMREYYKGEKYVSKRKRKTD